MAKKREMSIEPNDNVSVSVRKIDNGYIVAKSCYGNGEYHSSETFTKDKPKVELEVGEPEARAKPKAAPVSSLSTAMKHAR